MSPRYENGSTNRNAVDIPAVLKSYNPYDPDHDIDRSYEFNTIRNHLFVCRVDEALSKAGASGAVIPAMPFCPEPRFLLYLKEVALSF